MTPEDRQQLLDFREQSVWALDSAQRIADASKHAEAPETFREANETLVQRLKELIVFIDFVLSDEGEP